MKTVKLADVCEIIAGQSPVGSSYNDRGDGMEFHQGKKLFGEMQLQSSRVFTSQPTKIAEPGDILMSVRAPVGPANFTDRQICIGRGLAAIRVGDEVDKEYLFHFLRLNESKINGKEGATFASINKSEIGEIELPLPSLAEQHRIVERLDGIFAQIDRASVLLEENIANTNALKQSLLAQAFDADSATHTHRLATLGAICLVRSSRRVLKSQWTKSGVPFYRGREITRLSRTGVADNELFISEKLYQSLLKSNDAPAEGDIMLTAIGTIGNSYVVRAADKFYFKDASVLWLRPNPEVNSLYLDLWLKSDAFKRQLEDNGTTVNTLTISKLQGLSIALPSLADQEKITLEVTRLLERSTKLSSTYKHKLQQLINLKQSLLAEAFSVQ